MVLKNIIRKGDTTTHGGTVIEGIDSYLVYDKPVSCKGHMTICPQCKGSFPIIDGVSSMPIHGKHPAIEGMKTACGAKLISSQNEFKLEQVSGGSNNTANSNYSPTTNTLNAPPHDDLQDYGARFFVVDSETGEPMKHAKYFALVNEVEIEGYTDENGYATVHANGPEDVIKLHISFVTPKRPLNKEGE